MCSPMIKIVNKCVFDHLFITELPGFAQLKIED